MGLVQTRHTVSAIWRECAQYLGVALANTCTALNPEVLVLGGGVLHNAPTLRAMAVEVCGRWVNPPARAGLKIVDAALGDHAGVVGAALLARRGQAAG